MDAQIYRSSRIREHIQEAILRDTILIEMDGAVSGQANGLSVITSNNYAFGGPNRITARIRLDKGEVVDIERQVELGGPIHSKGVMILAGFLGARYAAERPLSLSATLVFEQSYSEAEGDSASSALVRRHASAQTMDKTLSSVVRYWSKAVVTRCRLSLALSSSAVCSRLVKSVPASRKAVLDQAIKRRRPSLVTQCVSLLLGKLSGMEDQKIMIK